MKRTVALLLLLLVSCVTTSSSRTASKTPRPGDRLYRKGDEIVVCGQLFHTGAKVVLWMDPGGYDAYRPHRHLDEKNEAPSRGKGAARYGTFRRNLPPDVERRVLKQGWDIADLRRVVNRIVLHYDAAGSSQKCFTVLHDVRGLSAHFMLDVDGTIYQTLDVKERAWHAGTANDDSVGIEIANLGAYPDAAPLGEADDIVAGEIQGQSLYQRPFTNRQYDALARLCVTLCRVLPEVRREFPRGPDGVVVPAVMPVGGDDFAGILGHYHLTRGKVDPGPAFDWERLEKQMRKLR